MNEFCISNNSERASVDNYKSICTEFIEDISKDYISWIDRYKLPLIEDKKRRSQIIGIITKTNKWIKYAANTIQSIDIIMNDGIQKMAEATAGKPFQVGVFVNKQSEYTTAKPGIININIKSVGRKNRKTRLGFHQKNSYFRLETTSNAFFNETSIPSVDFDFMNIDLKLNAAQCTISDIISFTVIIVEVDNGIEIDKCGVSTILRIT